MSDLLVRMKHWLQYARLSSGEKLMGEAVAELERLQIVSEQRGTLIEGIEKEIERLVRDLRKACDDWRTELQLNARQRAENERLRNQYDIVVRHRDNQQKTIEVLESQRDECRRLLREALKYYEIAHHAIMDNDHVDADFVDITLRRKWYEAAKAAGGE